MARWQQEQVGPERFWIIEYEELCRDPKGFASRVSRVASPDGNRAPILTDLQPFEPSTRIRVSEAEYERILQTFASLEGRESEYWVEPLKLVEPASIDARAHA
jgi:hypothetical protein